MADITRITSAAFRTDQVDLRDHFRPRVWKI